MLNARQKIKRSPVMNQATAPLGRPGARIRDAVPDRSANDGGYAFTRENRFELTDSSAPLNNASNQELHPLTNKEMNTLLYSYERNVKAEFDDVEAALYEISAMKHEPDFGIKAQRHIRTRLGIEIPGSLIDGSSRDKPDTYIRKLYAWCLFEVYQSYCNSFSSEFPSAMSVEEFQSFIQDCGFHTVDVSPCADGRLAHVISYVLRLHFRSVRRKSYAGAMFDVEDTLDKWVETELKRFREGVPNTSDAQTRYLKVVIYHFSSMYPDTEGCAAHGSSAELAARSGIERLQSFKQAVENTYCCGASIDQLLIGLDTDRDTIRIHLPDERNEISMSNYVDSNEVYNATREMSGPGAKSWIEGFVESKNPRMPEGLARFISFLLTRNISQIDYVSAYYDGQYSDIGHAERFIGAGMGFEEVQLRNLTFFSYLKTVEESAGDLDVGIKIFRGLNISKGLPVPVVVRFDYHSNVPGSRERAVEHCHRVNDALNERYQDLVSQGLLYTLMVTRDVNKVTPIEKLGSSVVKPATQEALE